MILYYSACGNSRFVAETLAEMLDQSLEYIPELIDNDEYIVDCDGDMLGFVFPVYGWDVPKVVYEYMSKMQLKGKPTYLWFACTCGDNIGQTCDMFRIAVQKKGLNLDAAFTFQMPETYLCFPGFKLDTKEGADAKIDAVRQKLPKVAESIRKHESVEDLIPGGWPRFKTKVIGSLFNLLISDSSFHTNEECIGCGLCAQKCPFHNIEMAIDSNGIRRPKWGGNCTQCMACYHYCPQNAVHYGKMTIGKGQYHF